MSWKYVFILQKYRIMVSAFHWVNNQFQTKSYVSFCQSCLFDKSHNTIIKCWGFSFSFRKILKMFLVTQVENIYYDPHFYDKSNFFLLQKCTKTIYLIVQPSRSILVVKCMTFDLTISFTNVFKSWCKNASTKCFNLHNLPCLM